MFYDLYIIADKEEMITMLWWTAVIFLVGLFHYPSLAYRDGARNNSCFNHTIDHRNSIIRDCDAPNCRYFLIIKEVFMENLTDMSTNVAENITCGEHLYSSTFHITHTRMA